MSVTSDSELLVFPKGERRRLDDLSDETFQEVFSEFQTLLIRIADRTVIAGIRSGHHQELLASFRAWLEENEHDSELENLTSFAPWPGPATVARYAQRISSEGKSTDFSR